MKIKLIMFIFAITLFFSGSFSIFAQQSDFYGSWTGKISDDDETVYVKITISASTMIMSMELYEDNKIIDTELLEARIVRWIASNNTDRTTRAEYPNGFEIILNAFGEEDSIEIFISRDKRQITIPILNEDFYEIIVFRKQ
ncbi:MAG: hypothetical protein FWD28_05165 [Treponema sp.]|nr:hypothetical protein [Treponema sp.]